MNSNFGLNLRAERELRGISIQEMSQLANIPIRHLELCERNEFDKLPKGLYLKRCIKAYIEHLGLDPDRVFLEFEYINSLSSSSNSAINRTSRITLLGWKRIPVISFIILTALLLMCLLPFSEDGSGDEAAGSTQRPEEITDEASFRSELRKLSAKDLTLDLQGFDSNESSTFHIRGFIQVHSKSQTWMKLTSIGSGLESLEVLYSGDRRVIPIKEEAILEFGDPSIIEIMDSSGQALADRDQTKSMHFIPDGNQDIIIEDAGSTKPGESLW